MKFIQTPFNDAYIIEPVVHGDQRGFFMESYSQKLFSDAGIPCNFIQDNHSKSSAAGVLRGLHYQIPPMTQTKLVRVTHGAVLDVIVDIRTKSPTFGQWFSVELSAQNFKMLLVPHGFAHGFCTLLPDTEFVYKVDSFYSPEHERGILWNDPQLSISWPTVEPVMSKRDTVMPLFRDVQSPF